MTEVDGLAADAATSNELGAAGPTSAGPTSAGPTSTTPVRLGTQLTPMQRGLLASQRRHPGAPHQNMSLVSHLDGPIDPTLLGEAFATVVARFDALRTRIDDVDGVAVAQVSPSTPEALPSTEVIDLDRDAVTKWAAQRASTPIDLSVGPADSVLLRHADGTSSWYLAFHHVAIDATSSAMVFAAVGDAYQSLLTGQPATASGDSASGDSASGDSASRDTDSYYQWFRREVRREPSPRSAKVDRFWATRGDVPKIGRLYEAVTTPTPLSRRVEVDPGDRLAAAERLLGADLRMLSLELGWTTLMISTAALYLHRLTGADHFAIGMPVHNRSTPEARRVIGPVMDVFGVDIVVEPDDTARSLHKRIGRSVLTTLRNAEVGRSAPADFETVVNVIPNMGYGDFGPIPSTTKWIHSGATDPSHLLRVQLTGYGSGDSASPARDHAGPRLQLALDLNEAAVGPEHVETAPGHFLAAFDAFLGDLDAPIAARSLITADEAQRITDWGTGAAAPDPRGPVIEQLRSAVNQRIDTVIESVDGTEALSGVELWQRVAARAAALAARGVRAGDRVAIERGRSIGTVIDIYAVMTLGASYVPLDPSQPRARLDSLIDRAGTILTLTSNDPTTVDAAPNNAAPADSAPNDPTTIDAAPNGKASNDNPPSDGGSSGEADIAVAADVRTRPAIDPNDEAYLLFTSGSTGEPKGVPITQWGLAGYVDFARTSYFEQPPVAALFTALTFDLTVTTLFAPLLAGGRLVVIEDDGPAAVRAIADRPDITWAKATPSHLDLLLRWIPEDHALRTLVVGGEAFTSRLARRLWDWQPEIVLFNEYGPTEAVVGCMIHRADPAMLGVDAADPLADVPIGVPAPGVHLAVLDRYQQLVPIGAVGELYISHTGVTAGYLGTSASADETNESTDGGDPFVEMDGRRWYRSGDLVRLVGDPLTLVYLGRSDEQVKIGGIRLDPSEVEQALAAHPAVSVASVRVWSPTDLVTTADVTYCVRCGLSSKVPGTVFDADGVCAVCHSYDRVKVQAASYFRTKDDLVEIRDRARAQRTGRYDAVHLLSGGKDSTYALYQLVELGFDVLALTLDNGFISEGAKENARRSAADLGIDHEFMSTPAMNEIFRDSLERFSNVCNGCYKTIYTLATTRAAEEGAPVIFTGLSRGQLFETRLIPQQFSGDRFDAEAIDRAVVEARRAYHRSDDVPNRLLDTTVFQEDAFREGALQEGGLPSASADGDLFDRISYVDFFRYVDVELAEMFDFLDRSAPWVRPSDTGRSTNCLINAAGIHSHLVEQGYHNYAEPYAWDVRLGHKTRDEALEELDDRDDLDVVLSMLSDIDYQPRPRQVLTAWIEVADGATMPEPAELRQHLAGLLPSHAIPAAYVAVEQLPTTPNGKLDAAALPAPERVHRPGPSLHVEATSDLERLIVERWERLLKIEPISATDDFFDLGGDSLMALEMIVALGERLDLVLPEEMAFANTTPRLLAGSIEAATNQATVENAHESHDHPKRRSPEVEPPFSAGELSLLFQHLDDPDDPRYNICRLYDLDGSAVGPSGFDRERFAAAVYQVIERHVPLHWSFGFPRRRLSPEQVLDLSIEPTAATPDTIRSNTIGLQSAPFDLENGPLVRCRIQRIADPDGTASEAISIALVFHHISIDAASFDLFWAEVDVAYRGEPLADLDVDYADVAGWQAGRPQDRAKAHWQTLNDGRPLPQPAWPSSEASDDAPSSSAGYRSRPIVLTRSDLVGHDGATPFVSALAAIAAAVGEHVEGDRVAIGMVGTTRDHPAAQSLIGYFINPLPIVLDLTASDDLIRDTAVAVRTAMAHRSYPYSTMVADRRRSGLDPLDLGVLVALQETAPIRLGDATISQQIIGTGSSIAPVTFFVQLEGEAVTLAIEYRSGTLTPAFADELLASIEDRLVAHTGHRGARPASEPVPGSLPTSAAPPAAAALHQLVFDAAAARPNEPAIIAEGATLTYAELTARAVQLAARLQALGVGPGDVVGVDASRRPLFAVAAMAVTATGAAYAPLDPTLPLGRLVTIVRDASIEFVIDTAPDAPDSTWPSVAVIDAVDVLRDHESGLHESGEQPAGFTPVDVDPNSAAYVLFTSGSTGTPKGVMVSHANIVATTRARTEYYPDPVQRFLVLSSFAFDSSAAGLYWALTQGGAVVLPDDGLQTEVVHLGDLIEQHQVTQLLALPSLYRLLLTENAPGRLSSLRDAIVAGEECPVSLVELHAELLPTTRLTNEYGPTEAAVWSHAHTFDPSTVLIGGVVPIGRPIPGALDRVVDDELWIGGAGVALGYLGRPDLTDERFVDIDGQRWYRTGDRVGVLDDGSLTFLGRLDHQVKLRGHRIEIGEIERVVESHPAVARAVSAVVEPAGRPTAMIVVWFEASRPVSTAELRAHAAALLPDVMQPGRFVGVDSLPLNVNGKVDRSALALPDETTVSADRPSGSVQPDEIVAAMLDADTDAALSGPARPPVSSASHAARRYGAIDQLTGLWAEALGIETVGPDDNYFDLGGDSIISIQIVARARKLGLDLKPRDVFEHQTVRALSAHLATTSTSVAATTGAPAADGRPAAASAAAASRTVDGPPVLDADSLPLLPIQHWLLEQQLPHLDHWAQYRWLDLADDVDLDRLEAAAATLPAVHSALRHRFRRTVDGWSVNTAELEAGPDSLIGIERHDLGETASPNWTAFADEVAGRIDLADGPTIRLAAFIAGGRRRCVIVAHHLVVDGVSWGVLLEDWAEAYRSGITPLPGGDVGEWARLLSSSGALGTARTQYPLWHRMLPGSPAETAPTTEADGRAVRRTLPADRTAALRRTGYSAALLSSLAVAGRSVLGWDHLEAIVEGHGREAGAIAPDSAVDLSRTVGWCTSHHPVSVPLAAGTDDAALRRTVTETLDRIPDRGIGFGIGRYLDLTSGLGYRPLPTVVFGFLGRVDGPSANDDVFIDTEPMTTSIHPANPRFHDLGLLAFISDGSLHIEVDGTRHHTASQLEALADAIVADLEAQAEAAPLPPAAISPALVGKRELVSLSASALRRVTHLLDRSTQSQRH